MRVALFLFALLAALIGGSGTLHAQDGDPPPGDPRDIPIEAFTGKAALSSAKLSQSGSRFAYVTTIEDKFLLDIFDADTRERVISIDLGSREGFNWFHWAGDDRILISRDVLSVMSLFGFKSTRLVMFDITKQEQSLIGFEKMGPEGDDLLYTDPHGNYVLLSASKRGYRRPEVWRFPLDGSGEDGAVRVQKSQKDVHEWFADNEGVVRLGMSWSRGGAMKIYYRSNAEEKFQRVTKVKRGDDTARDAWDVMGIYAGRDTGYALVEGDDGRNELREVNYATGEVGRLIHRDPRWSLESTLLDFKVGPIGVRYTDDRPRTVWFDKTMAEAQTALEGALPGSRITITDHAARDRMLVLQSSDADPGALYVFTRSEGRLDLFANLRPDLDFRLLSEGSAHEITARDGTKMRVLLTLPKGRDPKGLPLIIMPHGGPYGVRDLLVYDDWTQLLASRGYAVLRPNFRGSGGYGDAFERLGDGQMGRAMQDDLDDAMDWVVGEGMVDPARVCLFGASYGGYASMWGAIRNPERYRCAASFSGVSDWEDLLKYDKDYLGRGRTSRKWYRQTWIPRVTGEEDFDLASISVTDQIGRLTRPLFVAHGKKDRRVPLAQHTGLKEAAAAQSVSIEAMELETDHYLSEKEEELKFLRALTEFLQTHNPAWTEQELAKQN